MTSSFTVPFNKPDVGAKELDYITQALYQPSIVGDGVWTHKCHAWLRAYTGADTCFITNSCTTALEMAALLLDLKPGDEVIMPSYTFVSTANAFVLHNGTPVFVDICRDTKNIDPVRIEKAITPRTKAIVVMHYGGMSCDMDAINALAKAHGLYVVEDAAQGVGAYYKGRPQGALSDLGTLSFHGTKNIVAGEGGALIVNNPLFAERARIIREKGTDRAKFLRGEVDKYTWVDVGSSYLPSEITAAFLLAQLERLEEITKARLEVWEAYHAGLAQLEAQGLLERHFVDAHSSVNGHIYYIMLPTEQQRTDMLAFLKARGVHAMAHYVPLHASPGGQKYGRTCGSMEYTHWFDTHAVRLPLWSGLTRQQVDYVIESCQAFFKG